MYFRKPLLVPVHQVLGKELEVAAHQLQRLAIVLRQLDLLPHVLGRMAPLDGLHVQIADAVLLLDRGVAVVGERAGAAQAQARDAVGVAAEVALLGHAGPEGAEAVPDDIPDHSLVLHRWLISTKRNRGIYGEVRVTIRFRSDGKS